jgi:hypothetical protein
MTNASLKTANPDWGFFGGIAHAAEPARAWAIAIAAVAEATGCDGIAARDFLDSRHGRHFADDAVNELGAGRDLRQAIGAAVQRWMGWRIDRRTARETGIPAGLPYLTGFVEQARIMAEAAD